MSTVNDEPLIEREEGRKLHEEANKLLLLAEGFQDKCEQYERSLWMLLATGVSMFAVLLLAGMYLGSAVSDDSVFRRWAWPLESLYSLAVVAFLYWMAEKTRRKMARERRALHSIVDMLRGLEKGIAEKDSLSTLERAEFRIRLSRFDIGPG